MRHYLPAGDNSHEISRGNRAPAPERQAVMRPVLLGQELGETCRCRLIRMISSGGYEHYRRLAGRELTVVVLDAVAGLGWGRRWYRSPWGSCRQRSENGSGVIRRGSYDEKYRRSGVAVAGAAPGQRGSCRGRRPPLRWCAS